MSPAELLATDALLKQLLCLGAFGLILLGLGGMLLAQHLIRIILSFGLLQAGIQILLAVISFRPEQAAFLLTGQVEGALTTEIQLFILTAIIINLVILMFAVILLMRIHQLFGFFDKRKLMKRFYATIR